MVAVLLAQFLLGSYVNLYVPIASISGSTHTPTGMAERSMMSSMSRAMSGAGTLIAHMLLGWLLLLGAILALLIALRSGNRSALALASTGLAAVAIAGFGGLQFMATGNDRYSFLMATGFAAALAAYTTQLFLAHQPPPRFSRPLK